MSIAQRTGRTRVGPCKTCGVEVEQEESQGLTCSAAGKTWWSSERHKAPCGRWCLGGGLQRGEEFASIRDAYREAHGTKDGCLTCGPVPPERVEEPR